MLRLNHVSLTVTDRDRSAAFYRRYFGLGAPVHDDDHLLILPHPSGGYLAFVEGPPPTEQPRGTHFGFQADTPEDVLALRQRFADDGIPEAEFQDHAPTRVQVFDPDGYRVEAYAI